MMDSLLNDNQGSQNHGSRSHLFAVLTELDHAEVIQIEIGTLVACIGDGSGHTNKLHAITYMFSNCEMQLIMFMTEWSCTKYGTQQSNQVNLGNDEEKLQ